jgi:Do/DeqQ family serine protease
VNVNSFADIVSKVAPAVVTIRSERVVRAPRAFPFTSDPFFRDFFGGAEPQPRLQRGLGSGVVVTADGYVLTNHHVIDGADEIRVELSGRRTVRAKVVGSDPPTDLAVLQIGERNLPLLHLGDSDQVRVGDVCLAIGNPLGVGQTVTAGIISAKERSTGLGDGSYESFLQTDAPINRGNSGGALVNTAGELIGINSQIVSTTGGSIGIGFAIPSNMARQVSEQLIKAGNVRRGKLGVTIQPVSGEIASSLGLKDARGVIVTSVEPGGPADKAGLRQGDIITQLNRENVDDSNELRNRVAALQPGTEVTLTVFRDGSERQIQAKLVELTSGQARERTPSPESGGTEQGRYGITVTPLTPELSARLRLRRDSKGLVVTEIDPIGPAAEAGVQPGDLIQQVNQQPVGTVSELRGALEQSGERPALLLIQRQGGYFYATVQPR